MILENPAEHLWDLIEVRYMIGGAGRAGRAGGDLYMVIIGPIPPGRNNA
jgi:hypothetical protein